MTSDKQIRPIYAAAGQRCSAQLIIMKICCLEAKKHFMNIVIGIGIVLEMFLLS
jgi:hypothetical protein